MSKVVLTEEEKSALIKEYEEMRDLHYPEIDKEIKLASKHLAKAQELCDKYGISMYPNISFLSQGYTPSLEGTKFIDVLDELIDADLFDGNEYGEGWAHSQVCY